MSVVMVQPWTQAQSALDPTPLAPLIAVQNIGKSYAIDGVETAVLQDVSLEIAEGAFVTLLGRSGSGKSTLLRLISGLLPASTGTLTVGGAPVSGPVADARYVFQDYGDSLFPWLKVRENVIFGLRHAPKRQPRPREMADHYLDLVGLAEVADRYPWELSGGMQQRLAIARALASQPRLLLMDEPFGAVDALSRSRLQDLILRLWRELDLTVLLVTHDIDEAAYLGDRVIVLEPAGRGIRADVRIDLDHPRHQLETRESPAFIGYRRDLYRLVLE